MSGYISKPMQGGGDHEKDEGQLKGNKKGETKQTSKNYQGLEQGNFKGSQEHPNSEGSRGNDIQGKWSEWTCRTPVMMAF